MRWYHYLTHFFGGVFLMNAVPHLVSGTLGRPLQSPFASPPGVGLTERLGAPVQRVNTIVNGKRGVTAETALPLSRVLNTSPEFWMNLQSAVDLWNAEPTLQRAAP